MIQSKEDFEHYIWGNNCDSWVLLNSKNPSIKQEIMPPKTKEQLHFHKNAQQFFFILKGKQNFIKKEIFWKCPRIQAFTFAKPKSFDRK
jgi:mannose-6-phosphate isomerase-like protein (cupin superfamily)